MIDVPTVQLARDYASGASLDDLARRYPLCRTAILYRLRRFGVRLRRKGAPRGNQNARQAQHSRDDPPS